MFDGKRAWSEVLMEERSSAARSRRLALRQLYQVTACLDENTSLTELHNILEQIENNSAPVAAKERDFLDANDLLNGRYFDDSTLAFPSIPQHDGTYASKPSRQPTRSSSYVQAGTTTDGLATEATLTKPTEPARSIAGTAIPDSAEVIATADSELEPALVKRETARQLRAPSGPPGQLAPPSAEDEANLSSATKEMLRGQSPQRPAKTVHLPPQAVQEEALRERREAREDVRRKSDSRPAHLLPPAELASSPSSTVGAYSMTTPMPAQDSPDTSPDSATAHDQVLPPEDLRPSSEEQQEQEEHDRILAAQKDLARKEAFGEVTPDDQLNWEAREAAAREEEEMQAREDVNGPEPDAKNEVDKTDAEQVMEDVQTESATQMPITPATSHDEKPAAQTLAESQDDDGDSITVVPRARLPPLDTGKGSSSAAPPRMTTRVSSGALSRKSFSQPARENSKLSRQASSPEPVSPAVTTRRSQEDAEQVATAHLRTPRRQTRQIDYHTPGNSSLPLQDLAPLKGVAEDPERDYLEPLFRIQAHDSPNSHSKALPDLVKSAHKSLSTEDQFTQLHERMDYRILRRIYQLQNANKWSLRQMERAKEPAQPVTHHDHMMAEMRWMRRDFQGERKMKKSVCAWLAARCSDWVAADGEARNGMQVKVKPAKSQIKAITEEQPPDLDMSGESAPEDDMMPPTPKYENSIPTNLVVVPELTDIVCNLQKMGKLGRALQSLPVVGFERPKEEARIKPLNEVSKFVEGKVLPKAMGPLRKRSRFEYADDAEELDDEPNAKRPHFDRDQPPEDQEVALFHPDNKPIRDRLHANNAFRPPSEFVMPGTTFYEFRNGSQWVWEDDQKLRKLAKEYSFNWSLIADEMTLTSRYKSSADRRTPWECFERWVELEQLPAEMRKTMYFKTWFQRLEQSQQASERRYQSQVQHIQAQAQGQNGAQTQVPQRRRTIPTRVEKRKNTRYLWLVEAMRKNAKKRENNAYKQAEAQRAAAQRKLQNDNNTQPRAGPRMTPQEFSKKRQERDLQIAEAQRIHRLKMMDAQQRQLMQARGQQPGGAAAQQRPGTSGGTQQHGQMQNNGQPGAVNMNGQLPQQARPPLPMATRNGHLAVPQVNAQGIPQAQMQPGSMSQQQQHQQMARLAQANAHQQNARYGAQQYQMANGAMASPGGNMTTAQQLQNNQALLAQMSAQSHNQQSQAASMTNGHAMSASPSMPPPPTPHSQQAQPQQLSSGHVPALMLIKNTLRQKNPNLSEEQLNNMATSELRQQSQSQTQSTSQARQNAMNAAAGIPPSSHPNTMQPAYGHNQQAFQNNAQSSNGNAAYMNGDGSSAQQQAMSGTNHSPQAATAYAAQMRRQAQSQMLNRMQSSPNGTHAQLAGSPSLAHVSPSMAPASPSLAYAGMGGQMAGMNGARPSSRSNTPAMPRMGSSNSVPMAGGMQSPGGLAQSSPRMQTNMAR
ncbi:RNA polymerase II transcription elongation factor SpEAF [Elasticomyces elasticus]|nr:RNA polymerase II transcription elongation factor SpEAF [Elasticomyces elasticus]